MYSRPSAAFKPPRPQSRSDVGATATATTSLTTTVSLSNKSRVESKNAAAIASVPLKARPNLKRVYADDASGYSTTTNITADTNTTHINSTKRPNTHTLLLNHSVSLLNGSSSPLKKVSNTKYIVLWRRKTNKKNKSWDGDGQATIKYTPGNDACDIVLKGSDGGIMSRKTFKPPPNLTEIIPIGGFEISLDEEIGLGSIIPREVITSTNNNGNNDQVRLKPISLVASTSELKRAPTGLSKRATSAVGVAGGVAAAAAGAASSGAASAGTVAPILRRASSLPKHAENKSTDQMTKDTPSNNGEVKKELLDAKYLIQWRKKTTKKNKSWDGDGSALIKFSGLGCEILVKNTDGKVMSKKKFDKLPDLSEVIPIGVFEIFLDEKIAELENNIAETSEVQAIDAPSESSTHEQNPTFSGAPPPPPHPPSTSTRASASASSTVLHKSFKKVIPKDHEQVQEKRNALYEEKADEVQMTPPPEEPDPVKVSIDPHLASKLRPHQIEGVTFMYECVMGFRDFVGNGCLLADEMGLGKTLMTITTIWTLLKQNPFPDQKKPIVNKVLIVCPVTLINNWKAEFKKWLGTNKLNVLTLNNPMSDDKRDIVNFGRLNVYQVLIINYEKVLAHLEELQTVNFDLLVCDEGHRLKNSSNKVLINLHKLLIPKRIVLTGTPIQNYLVEFHTLISFINPAVLPDMKTFQRKFINPITQARDVNCFNPEVKRKGEELSKELIRLTHKFILRRTQDLLEGYLTPKTDILLFVPPTQLQIDIFQLIRSSEKFKYLEPGLTSLALINVFRKICNSPSLLAADEFYQKIATNNFKLSTSSGKIHVLIPLLLEITECKERTVLISNYTKTLDLLEHVLRKLNLRYTRLDGSTPNNMRNKLVNEFNRNEEIHVFLLSSKSGGMGINLVGASRLILFDNDWNPSTDLQSLSRIHRDGQTKPCFIYRLFTAGCIDEKIFQRQLMKSKLSSKFLDNDNASKTDVFEQEDLKNLFEVNVGSKSNTHELLGCSCAGDGSLLTQEIFTDDEIDADDDADDDNNDHDDAKIEDEDYSDNDVSEVQVQASQRWMSAAELQKNMDRNGADVMEKRAVKDALNDYHHYDPEISHDLAFDPVLLQIAKNSVTQGRLPFSFIMMKQSAGRDDKK